MDIKVSTKKVQRSVEVFCCYARKDQILLQELEKHLVPLVREGLITLWADTSINAGVEWEKEIHLHLNASHLILLLVSPDFMASDYCYSIEMARAMKRHESGEVQVIPIILRPIDWQDTPFAKLQALPHNARPIISSEWNYPDEGFADAARGIRKAVVALLAKEEQRRLIEEAKQARLAREAMQTRLIEKGRLRKTEEAEQARLDEEKRQQRAAQAHLVEEEQRRLIEEAKQAQLAGKAARAGKEVEQMPPPSNQAPLRWPKRLRSPIEVAVLVGLVLIALGGGSVGAYDVVTGHFLWSPGSNNIHRGNTAIVTLPDDLLTPGTLTVGSDTTYPPQEYIDSQTGKAAGFDIDLITAIAEQMGLNVNIVSTGFDTILDSLSAKHFDVVISAVVINGNRQMKADFVPYFKAGESLLVPKGNPKHLTSINNACGLKIGVQAGTVELDDAITASTACMKAGKPVITIIEVQNQTDVVQLLTDKRVDATYQDSPVTDYYNALHPGQFEVGGSVVNAAPEGIAVRKGNTSMLDSIQTAFNQLKVAGIYDSLFKKWKFENSQKVG